MEDQNLKIEEFMDRLLLVAARWTDEQENATVSTSFYMIVLLCHEVDR